MAEECENLIEREVVSVDDGMQEVYNEAKASDEEQSEKKTEKTGDRPQPRSTKQGTNICAAESFTVFCASLMSTLSRVAVVLSASYSLLHDSATNFNCDL